MVVFPFRKLWPAGNNPTVRLTLLSQVALYLESINIQQRHLLLGATFPMPPLRWLLLFPSKKTGGFSIRKILPEGFPGKGDFYCFKGKPVVFPAEFPSNPLRLFWRCTGAKVDDLQRLPCDVAPKSAGFANVGVVNFQMELHGQAIHESYEWFTNPFSLLNIFIITGVLIPIDYIILLYIHE